MNSKSTSDIRYLLYRTRGIGPSRTFEIAQRLKGQGRRLRDIKVDEVVPLLQLFPRWGQDAARAFSMLDLDQHERDFNRLQIAGITLLSIDDADYPYRLIERLGSRSPTPLFLNGNERLTAERGVSIVGSRRASPEALSIAGRLAGELAFSGFNIVSGYADGIDTAAHRGALENDGTTTVVLSQGILGFRAKRALQDVFRRDDVLVISHFPPSEPWSGRNAMARNLLVCALAEAVVIIESGLHTPGKMSGTFDAGEKALRMKVPLFVVEPSFLPNNPDGNRLLIKLGAIPCTPEKIVQRVLEHEHVRSAPTTGQQLSMSL